MSYGLPRRHRGRFARRSTATCSLLLTATNGVLKILLPVTTTDRQDHQRRPLSTPVHQRSIYERPPPAAADYNAIRRSSLPGCGSTVG